MTIITILPEYFENFVVETHPHREYNASGYSETAFIDDETGSKFVQYNYSSVTGNVNVYARRSDYDKDKRTFAQFVSPDFNETDILDTDYKLAKTSAINTGNNFNRCRQILTKVNNRLPSQRKQKTVEVIRFPAPADFIPNFARKQTIREILYPYYRTTYPTAHWTYANYNCLNFFTGSNAIESVPTGSVLMYPNQNGTFGLLTSGSIDDNIYIPDGAFTFDFRINPRYTTHAVNSEWTPGTIFHLPELFSLSLISGTHRDPDGYIDRFGLMLQIREGTLTNPSDGVVAPGTGIFTSSLDALHRNHWHHVAVRWGTNARDNGTGSFIVDGQNVGNFVIPSSSLKDTLTTNSDVLFLGNYFSGAPTDSSIFFSTTPAFQNGVNKLLDLISVFSPATYDFRNSLNAELHEIRIWNRYVDDDTLNEYSHTSVIDTSELLFYVPPLFTTQSPRRRVQQTLSKIASLTTTDDPFNTALAFGQGIHSINVENFTRDFANANYPLHWELTASVIATPLAQLDDPNNILYDQRPHARRRNLFIMPCDDGLFRPDYALLLSGSTSGNITSGNFNYKYLNDLDIFDPSIISLNNMVPDVEYLNVGTIEQPQWKKIIEDTLPDTGIVKSTNLTIQQKTRDESSNQITIFDISNLYYGNRIRPNTFEIYDPYLSGSAGRISVRLKDDGYGCLYRADSDTPHATWAHVGNLLYDEGLCVVKSPHLYFYGKESHQLNFDGVRNIHTFKVRVPAQAGQINSSSNPSYEPVNASNDANDYDKKFVYITGINLHDENLNVVMKGTLAQPVVKRTGDKIMFKLGVDF